MPNSKQRLLLRGVSMSRDMRILSLTNNNLVSVMASNFRYHPRSPDYHRSINNYTSKNCH